MLKIVIPRQEMFIENTETFENIEETTLQLEHSLISLSKWESKWHKPFLSTDKRTEEETMDYIRCMTITPNVDPKIYAFLTNENIETVNEYIKDPMTATWINDRSQNKKVGIRNDVVTSELIYYWMVALQIPFECQKWHLNRLLMLVEVTKIKNAEAEGKTKNMSRAETLSSYKSLNAARRKALNTKG